MTESAGSEPFIAASFASYDIVQLSICFPFTLSLLTTSIKIRIKIKTGAPNMMNVN